MQGQYDQDPPWDGPYGSRVMSTITPVLIVDDDLSLLRMYSIILKLEGFEVRGAENGRQALDVMHDFHPAVVLLDLQMPIMDGRTFFRAIEGLARPPVIVVSAFEADVACRELGAEAFLVKPFEPERMVGLVSAIASGRQAYNADEPLQRAVPLLLPTVPWSEK